MIELYVHDNRLPKKLTGLFDISQLITINFAVVDVVVIFVILSINHLIPSKNLFTYSRRIAYSSATTLVRLIEMNFCLTPYHELVYCFPFFIRIIT